MNRVVNARSRKKRSTRQAWAEPRWHQAGVNLYPSERALFEAELGRVIREQSIVGHVPDRPLLDATDDVITLGSCFAGELTTFLKRAGFLSRRIFMPEGLNTTYAMLDFISWCVTGEATGDGFRYERLESGDIREWLPQRKRETYAASIAEAGVFVLTIGLAEVWQDRETGGVFWHGIPEEIFDPDRHVFRLTTVEENADNVRRIVELVRQVNADAPIVLTLSPVPLKGTFRELACMSADCVSKSVLRVAIDQVMTEAPRGVYYWPSFEIVRWAGAHFSWPAYGLDDDKARHVSRRLVAEIVDAFVESFYTPEAVSALQVIRPGVPPD